MKLPSNPPWAHRNPLLEPWKMSRQDISRNSGSIELISRIAYAFAYSSLEKAGKAVTKYHSKDPRIEPFLRPEASWWRMLLTWSPNAVLFTFLKRCTKNEDGKLINDWAAGSGRLGNSYGTTAPCMKKIMHDLARVIVSDDRVENRIRLACDDLKDGCCKRFWELRPEETYLLTSVGFLYR
jgi:hypothetical protein